LLYQLLFQQTSTRSREDPNLLLLLLSLSYSMSVETATPSTIEPNLENLRIEEKLEAGTPTNATAISEGSKNEETSDAPKANPRKLPFEEPATTSTRPARAELSADEQAKYVTVLEHMKSITSLPTTSSKKNKETAPLSEVEQCFLTRECILRYLRATKWNVNEAQKRLEGTIIWRREYGTDTRKAETIEPEVLLPILQRLTCRH
jgi:hypothetical protein